MLTMLSQARISYCGMAVGAKDDAMDEVSPVGTRTRILATARLRRNNAGVAQRVGMDSPHSSLFTLHPSPSTLHPGMDMDMDRHMDMHTDMHMDMDMHIGLHPELWLARGCDGSALQTATFLHEPSLGWLQSIILSRLREGK